MAAFHKLQWDVLIRLKPVLPNCGNLLCFGLKSNSQMSRKCCCEQGMRGEW